jgi:hypothetical protein
MATIRRIFPPALVLIRANVVVDNWLHLSQHGPPASNQPSFLVTMPDAKAFCETCRDHVHMVEASEAFESFVDMARLCSVTPLLSLQIRAMGI